MYKKMAILTKLWALFLSLVLLFPLQIAQAASTSDQNYLVLVLKDGDVVIKLRPDLAPKHVSRIKILVDEGRYDHVIFHRVIDGFMAQTGDIKFGKKTTRNYNPALAGTGGSDYPNLPAEFSHETFQRGTVGMARASDPDSANSQFFICFEAAPFLNGNYTIVGEVVKGMDIVDKIKKGDANQNGAVTNPDEIIKARLSDHI